MKNLKLFALLLVAAMTLQACSEYDDTALRKDVDDLKSRVEKLETWCTTANSQISALQGLVAALEEKDFVTGVTPVTEGAKVVGYTIAFTKSDPITIRNGEDGEAQAPVVGVKKDTDDKYYWTVKVGDEDAKWLTDDGTPAGKKIPATGEAPEIGVAAFEGVLYWQIDGEWMLQADKKVPVTGEQGDSIFAEDGIDYETDPDNVIFTLADGETTITLPRANAVSISFESYDTYLCSPMRNSIGVEFAATFKKEQYQSITATVTNADGTGMDIVTRAAAGEGVWGVEIEKPSFGTDGTVVAGSCRVKVTAPADVRLADLAILKVTVVDAKGKEVSISRTLRYFDGEIAENPTAGSFNFTTPARKLAVIGSINKDDLTYIKTNLTNLEVLDLSMTDMPVMYDRGLAFYDQPNTTLRRVVLPSTVMAIEDAAFANCLVLESIDTENARSLGKWAFESCSALRDVRLGDKLVSIDNSAFMKCTSLTQIDIPASVQTLGTWAFENCTNLTTITLHEGLRTLSQSTFFGCGMVAIRIPSTVTEIPDYAFEGCKQLEHIYLHDGITDIGIGAFLRCRSLKDITIPKGVTVIKQTFNSCTNLQFVYFHDDITEIGEGAFENCYSLVLEDTNSSKPYNLPASLVTLGSGAFQNCTSLTRVSVPPLVETLPRYVFNGCKKLNAIILTDGLKQVDEWAFGMCSSLISIDLPATFRSFGDYVFHGCTSLRDVYCRATTAPQIGSTTFGNQESELWANRYLWIPSSVDVSVYSTWAPYFQKGVKNVL